ncbi:hypothetical protein BHM03_00032219, partial [Ensete ventricosum]
LLVECFTKYCVVKEAIRHFRALKNFPGGTRVLYNEGNFGDPLSLYLRALCCEGTFNYLLWTKRYVVEGGLTGERKRWVPRRGKTPLDPDALGFAYSNPMEMSFKQCCLEEWKIYHRKLLKTLRNEGPSALGDVSEADYIRVEERLKKIIKGPDQNALKPKAASKMIVSELKEELEAQGLPIDGTRQVLYQRVQKARRINRSRGRPLWVPPVEEEEEEVANLSCLLVPTAFVDEELDELISRIKLEDGNTEYWKLRFLGESLTNVHEKDIVVEDSELHDILDDADALEDGTKEAEEDDVDEEEEAVEQTENQEGDVIKDKVVERAKPLQMIGIQLLKDSEETAPSKKSRRRVARASIEVIELGGTPTIGDCAMILRAAIRAPLPSAFLTILHTTHSLGYAFGR